MAEHRPGALDEISLERPVPGDHNRPMLRKRRFGFGSAGIRTSRMNFAQDARIGDAEDPICSEKTLAFDGSYSMLATQIHGCVENLA